MEKFTIQKDEKYLKQNTLAYYNAKYTTMGEEGNPDYLNDLKNTYGKPDEYDDKDWAEQEQKKLDSAVSKLTKVLEKDLPNILKDSKKQSLSICVVPRSKSESTYKDNQRLFKSTVQSVAKELETLKIRQITLLGLKIQRLHI